MKTPVKILIVLLVVAAAAAAWVSRDHKQRSAGAANQSPPANAAAATTAATPPATDAKLPRLVDLGAGKCIPCKAMAPIIEELKKEYAGRMKVEFIDVWQDEEAAKPYDVDIIPLQVFFDANGKELFRHTGFFSKEDILAKWRELGVNFPAATGTQTTP
jgi:thioredoxin 1